MQPLLFRGSSGSVVRVSDWCLEGLGFKSQLVPEFFLWIHSFSLSKASINSHVPCVTVHTNIHTESCEYLTVRIWFLLADHAE